MTGRCRPSVSSSMRCRAVYRRLGSGPTSRAFSMVSAPSYAGAIMPSCRSRSGSSRKLNSPIGSPRPRPAPRAMTQRKLLRPKTRRPQERMTDKTDKKVRKTAMAQHAHVEAAHHEDHPTGWRRYVYSTNHKDIGTMYLVFALVGGIIGGILSIAMRIELMYPGMQLFGDPGARRPGGGRGLDALCAAPHQGHARHRHGFRHPVAASRRRLVDPRRH